MAIIVADGVTKTFRRPKGAEDGRGALRRLVRPRYVEHHAVRDLSLSVEQGEAVAYVGPNGAGKSTTVKMLTGILVPTSGTIRVAGLDPHRQRIANARQIGVVFGQRTQLWWDLPVADSLGLLRDMYGLGEAEYRRTLARFDEVLGIGELMPLMARKLSLGQRMRADLAAALLHRPPVVFLDEPTIGLDVDVKDKVRDFVRGLVDEGTTVVLTTHDMNDVAQICRRMVVIDDGRLLFDGPLDTVTRTFATEAVVRFTRSGQTPPDLLAARVPGITCSLDGSEVVARFDHRSTTPSDVLRAAFDLYDVSDVRVEEPGIESVIRTIYARTTSSDGVEP